MASEQSARDMQKVMKELTRVFPNCGIALIIAPFGAPPGARANWISNGEREDMIVLMEEVIARFEGRVHSAPEVKQ